MKTIGLLGGMSWESTRIYYREINRIINQILGGHHSAKMILVNVDFDPLEKMMVNGEWDSIAEILTDNCINIQKAGADFLAIATNTMHKLAPQIESSIDIPLLHIADTVGHELSNRNQIKVGLLGTAFTMEQDFYKARLKNNFEIETLIPNAEQRTLVNQIIFNDLCQGKFTHEARQCYLSIIEELSKHGAESIILGCTEIGLLVKQSDTEVPLIDATDSHIKHICELALNDSLNGNMT